MAYTTDYTWLVGEVVTAAYLNKYLRDNMKWLSTDKPMCRAFHNTTQAVVTATSTDMIFNSNRFDNASIHSTSVNRERFTIPSGSAGKWLFGGTILWAANGTGLRFADLFLTTAALNVGQQGGPADALFQTNVTCSTIYDPAAADYFTIRGYQTSGGNLNAVANTNAFAIWLGF